ncbi:MAG: ClbS/DfsB family four-helix bundle protein, partial [Methylococcaceae bacterium]|nr:ClbS/DfsB family four-helix bundle protein [Methylococcaceae bacterium]
GHGSFQRFRGQLVRIAETLAHHPSWSEQLAEKRARREADERVKALEQYRLEELTEMNQNFWGEDRSYHLARSAFVRKQPRPAHLACAVALETACGNSRCDEFRNRIPNRCALASVGWA